MNSYLTKSLAVAAIGGVFALTGCGDSKDDGPSAADAQKQFAAIDKKINDFGDQLGTAIQAASSKTDDELNAQFTTFGDDANQEVADVKGLDVPDDSADERDALADSLKDGVKDLNDIASAAQTHDANAAASATRTLISDAKQIDTDQKTLRTTLADAAKK